MRPIKPQNPYFDLKAEQQEWALRRYQELVVQQGFSKKMARELVEGQILEQNRSINGPIRKILDDLFGE
jgi:hypothetical protein